VFAADDRRVHDSALAGKTGCGKAAVLNAAESHLRLLGCDPLTRG
jgi:hypothetical protein